MDRSSAPRHPQESARTGMQRYGRQGRRQEEEVLDLGPRTTRYDRVRDAGHSDGMWNNRDRGEGEGGRQFGYSDMTRGEGRFVKSGVWNRRRREDSDRDSGGSTLRLSNIPVGVNIIQLKSIMHGKGILPGLYIKYLREGSGVVQFVEDWQRVVEKLGELKIGDCLVQIENMKDLDAKRDSRKVIDAKRNSDEVIDEAAVRNSQRTKQKVPSVKKTMLAKKEMKVKTASSKIPKNVTEADIKEAAGLDNLVPDYVEFRDGTFALVFSNQENTNFMEKLEAMAMGEKVEHDDPVKNVPSDKVEVDQELSNDDSKLNKEDSQDTATEIRLDSAAGVTDGQTIYDDEDKGPVELNPEVENKLKVEEAPVLQSVETMFAAMDVREKVKVLEQAKQKSFGDFLIEAKPRQGQIKKKKKRKPAVVEGKTEDFTRTTGR